MKILFLCPGIGLILQSLGRIPKAGGWLLAPAPNCLGDVHPEVFTTAELELREAGSRVITIFCCRNV
jgi:hypothetical protein